MEVFHHGQRMLRGHGSMSRPRGWSTSATGRPAASTLARVPPPHFTFRVHPERLAIARLAPRAPAPDWARGEFVSLTRTSAELSIVCAEALVPDGVLHEGGRIALGIEGTLPMSSVGILAALCGALAAAGVPVFVLSTHDTDWLLVPTQGFEAASSALRAAGHRVEGAPPTR